jgi:hypothetical protein
MADVATNPSLQDKANTASRQNDVFYRDIRTGLEIPALIPTGYLITGAIGLAIGYMIFRR